MKVTLKETGVMWGDVKFPWLKQKVVSLHFASHVIHVGFGQNKGRKVIASSDIIIL